MMAWYKRSKLGWDMFRNVALGSKRPNNCGKVLTSCLDDVGFFKKKSSWGLNYYYALVVMGVAASGGYLTNLETIPYSKRTHLLLLPRNIEKAVAEKALEGIKEGREGKVLPATHPMSVRVGLIAKKIIDALQRDLRGENRNVNVWGYWKFGNIKSCATQYTEHVNWEVVLVDGDPGLEGPITCGAGKIVLYTGILKDLNSDAEIAAFIVREVAHNVARHDAETGTKLARVISLEVLFDMIFGKSAMRDKILDLFVYSPLSRKLELEADYIGLLLMASAGYHPCVAVTLMQKRSAGYLADDNSYWASLFAHYPSKKKRVQVLSQAQEEAMNFYKNSKP